MRKPRPVPEARFVFNPQTDASYVHFEDHEQAPFEPRAGAVTRANAWWLADSALLSYWEASAAIPRFAGAGLEAELFERGDTQAYVAWSDAAVIVAFRGTQPGSVEDIVSDALIGLAPWPRGRVHFGFKAALDKVWPTLVVRLEALASTRAVWFTGHSLGAALATLAADRFPSSAGVCTLGSPRVGDRTFAAAFDERFGTRALRYVNDTDIVTHLPTRFPLPYEHAGVLRHISPDGVITSEAPALTHFVTAVFGGVVQVNETMNAVRSGAIRSAPDFVLDHMPRTYTVDIWNDFDAHRGP